MPTKEELQAVSRVRPAHKKTFKYPRVSSAPPTKAFVEKKRQIDRYLKYKPDYKEEVC